MPTVPLAIHRSVPSTWQPSAGGRLGRSARIGQNRLGDPPLPLIHWQLAYMNKVMDVKPKDYSPSEIFHIVPTSPPYHPGPTRLSWSDLRFLDNQYEHLIVGKYVHLGRAWIFTVPLVLLKEFPYENQLMLQGESFRKVRHYLERNHDGRRLPSAINFQQQTQIYPQPWPTMSPFQDLVPIGNATSWAPNSERGDNMYADLSPMPANLQPSMRIEANGMVGPESSQASTLITDSRKNSTYTEVESLATSIPMSAEERDFDDGDTVRGRDLISSLINEQENGMKQRHHPKVSKSVVPESDVDKRPKKIWRAETQPPTPRKDRKEVSEGKREAAGQEARLIRPYTEKEMNEDSSPQPYPQYLGYFVMKPGQESFLLEKPKGFESVTPKNQDILDPAFPTREKRAMVMGVVKQEQS